MCAALSAVHSPAPGAPRLVVAPQLCDAPLGLALTPAWCAAVQPQQCSPVLAALTQAAPVPGHLKRVWRTQEVGGLLSLRVLLCVPDASDGTDTAMSECTLPPRVAQLVQQFGLSPEKVTVPMHPPHDSATAASWSAQYWPVAFNATAAAAAAAAAEAQAALSESEIVAMTVHMREAAAQAEAAADAGHRRNGCVIVDPVTDAVVAVGSDASVCLTARAEGDAPTGWQARHLGCAHPLRHAVIAALDAAAARDLVRLLSLAKLAFRTGALTFCRSLFQTGAVPRTNYGRGCSCSPGVQRRRCEAEAR